jgi:hypothetical protein
VGGGVELSPASPRGGCNLPGAGRRPHRGGAILSRSAAISPAASGIKPPTENAPEKSPHGKRATKKRGKRGAGRVYLFFRVKFSGGWNHPPPVLLSSTSGGWNPSRAIRSRVAVRIYPATLSPELVAAAVKFSSSSFGIRIDFVMNFDK